MTYRHPMGILLALAACLTREESTFAQEPAPTPAPAKSLAKDASPKEAVASRPPEAQVAAPASSQKGIVVAGMFEGTFSVGRTRVVAGKNAAALVLASIAPDGNVNWMSSFDGLARGRAVASISVAEGGTLVVGVFKGKFDLGLPKQPGFESGEGDGLFAVMVTSKGRLTLARMLGLAGGFSAPTVQLKSGKVVVEVPYQGALSKVPLKFLPAPKPGAAVLHLEMSREGKLLSAAIVKAPTGADTKVPLQPAMGKPKGDPKMLAAPPPTLALGGGVCNVCIPSGAPLTDPACQSCNSHVCNDQSDLWCCVTNWDRQCINEAMQGTCSGRVCNCPHTTGQSGIWMFPQCASPPPAGCVNTVCNMDPYCTYIEWDNQCVGQSPCGGQ